MSRYSEVVKYLCVFPNCILAKGHTRSIIYDLQYGDFDYIPNGLTDIIQFYDHDLLLNIYKRFKIEDHSIIDDYIDFLLEHKYAYLSVYKYPIANSVVTGSSNIELFSNSIIELTESASFEYVNNIILRLQSLGVVAVKVIIRGVLCLRFFLEALKDKLVSHIELVMSNGCFVLNKAILSNEKIIKVSVYESNRCLSYEENNIHYDFFDNNMSELPFLCGKITLKKFAISIESYNDYLLGNTCLYGKICVDKVGQVKRCVFSDETFGSIFSDDFLYNDKFKSLGLVNHRNLERCRDCEYRVMCIDCRTFIQYPDVYKAPPLYCTYNPYNGEWE